MDWMHGMVSNTDNQHAAIVARELGIPAGLATGHGTWRFRDDQTITVNGAQEQLNF